MAFFVYTAKNEHAETVKGKVEAQTPSQAVNILRSRNLLVVTLKPETQGSFAFLNSFLFGVKHTDIVNFTRQLSTMITAGLSLAQALSILEQQSKPAMAILVAELLKDIEGGTTFAKALEKHPHYFSKVYTQLVKAGETAGVLDDILKRLAENMEKSKEFRAKTKGALIYPIIVLVAMVLVALVMMIFVIPKLTEMYKDFGADLPLPTQILIDISTLFATYWWVMLVLAGAAGFFLRTWGRTKEGKRKIGAYLLKLPIYGILRKKIILTEFSRTLSLLLGAGISLIQALEIVADAASSVLYQESLQDATKRVEKGIPPAQTLGDEVLYPPILPQMVSVGEETGKLDEVLLKLSTYFESESEQAIKNLTTAMEPIIMVVLGIGVALMTIAIILPIYSLTSQF